MRRLVGRFVGHTFRFPLWLWTVTECPWTTLRRLCDIFSESCDQQLSDFDFQCIFPKCTRLSHLLSFASLSFLSFHKTTFYFWLGSKSRSIFKFVTQKIPSRDRSWISKLSFKLYCCCSGENQKKKCFAVEPEYNEGLILKHPVEKQWKTQLRKTNIPVALQWNQSQCGLGFKTHSEKKTHLVKRQFF